MSLRQTTLVLVTPTCQVRDEFNYTFDRLSEIIEEFLEIYRLYTLWTLHAGLWRASWLQNHISSSRLARMAYHPEHNAYEVGFTKAWDGFRNALWKNRTSETEASLAAFLQLDAIKQVYLYGHKNPEIISPDNWNMDFRFMERPNARQVQMDLFYDYRTNVALYPQWQKFLHEHQPKTLIFWGQNDIFFTREGGEAYLKDLPNAEMHRLDSGHFAVEDCLDEITNNIHRFYLERVVKMST